MTYRSEKLRRAVAGMACVSCGKQGDTQEFGKNTKILYRDWELRPISGVRVCDEEEREVTA